MIKVKQTNEISVTAGFFVAAVRLDFSNYKYTTKAAGFFQIEPRCPQSWSEQMNEKRFCPKCFTNMWGRKTFKPEIFLLFQDVSRWDSTLERISFIFIYDYQSVTWQQMCFQVDARSSILHQRHNLSQHWRVSFQNDSVAFLLVRHWK